MRSIELDWRCGTTELVLLGQSGLVELGPNISSGLVILGLEK